MKRLIIDYEESFDALTLANRIHTVVRDGYMSKAKIQGVDTNHYPWVTTWTDGTLVYARRKKTPTAADSIIVSFNYQ